MNKLNEEITRGWSKALGLNEDNVNYSKLGKEDALAQHNDKDSLYADWLESNEEFEQDIKYYAKENSEFEEYDPGDRYTPPSGGIYLEVVEGFNDKDSKKYAEIIWNGLLADEDKTFNDMIKYPDNDKYKKSWIDTVAKIISDDVSLKRINVIIDLANDNREHLHSWRDPDNRD